MYSYSIINLPFIPITMSCVNCWLVVQRRGENCFCHEPRLNVIPILCIVCQREYCIKYLYAVKMIMSDIFFLLVACEIIKSIWPRSNHIGMYYFSSLLSIMYTNELFLYCRPGWIVSHLTRIYFRFQKMYITTKSLYLIDKHVS